METAKEHIRTKFGQKVRSSKHTANLLFSALHLLLNSLIFFFRAFSFASNLLRPRHLQPREHSVYLQGARFSWTQRQKVSSPLQPWIRLGPSHQQPPSPFLLLGCLSYALSHPRCPPWHAGLSSIPRPF